MPITISDRTAYVAANVKPAVKHALEAEGAVTKTSVSMFVSNLLEEWAKGKGYDVDEPEASTEVDEPLPFEAPQEKA